MQTVANNLRFILYSIKCNVSISMAYKKNFIMQIILMVFSNAFFLVFWATVFGANSGDINGLVFNDVLCLWSIGTISYGLANFVFGGVNELNKYIITGTLDSYLLQPKSVILNVLTSKCDLSAFGDIVYGMLIGIFAVGGNILGYLQILFFSVIAMLIYLAINITIRTLSIWIGDVENLASTYEYSLYITFSTYPEQIFKNGVKLLLYTVIPVVYSAYFPVRIINNFNWGYLGIVILAVIVYLIIASVIFKKGLKKYESGNSMLMRG